MRAVSLLLLGGAVGAALAACADNQNNRFTVEDVNDAALDIHFENVNVNTYDDNLQPNCFKDAPSIKFPGKIKLVSGDIRVTKANDLTKSEADLTLQKDSLLVGKVCDNGHSKNALIPDKDCRIENPCTILGDDLCSLLGKPGTYDLATIEKELNISSVVSLPSINGAINSLLKGDWQIGMNIVLSGRTIGQIKIPGNAKWINLD